LNQMKKNKNVNKFLIYTSDCLSKNGIKLHLSFNKHEYVDDMYDGGFFDNEQLCCFANGYFDHWLSIYVHEYCHFLQSIDKTFKISINEYKYFILVDNWLKKKDIDIKKIQIGIDLMQKVELDCEKRSINMIKLHKLPIDINKYAQKANSYIFYIIICISGEAGYTINKSPLIKLKNYILYFQNIY